LLGFLDLSVQSAAASLTPETKQRLRWSVVCALSIAHWLLAVGCCILAVVYWLFFLSRLSAVIALCYITTHPWQHAAAHRPIHSRGRTVSPLSTAVPWCVLARCRAAVTALRRSRTPCWRLAHPQRFITRMGCHRPRQPGCQPRHMGPTAAGNNRLVGGPAPRSSERAQ
jgi:hypothetical protein